MIVSIHQPNYWPWLGLLHKIANSDLHIILDDVPVSKGSHQYRNMFFCEGKSKHLTLPITINGEIKIIDLQYKNQSWVPEHLDKLSNYYRRAPNFTEIMDSLKMFYVHNENKLPVDLIINSMKFAFEYLGIKTKIIRSSTFSITSKKGQLVLDICKVLNADIYLSGIGAKSYLGDELLSEFKKNNILIKYQYFQHPVYPQFHSGEFISGLSCLDLFFNCRKETSREIFEKSLTLRNETI